MTLDEDYRLCGQVQRPSGRHDQVLCQLRRTRRIPGGDRQDDPRRHQSARSRLHRGIDQGRVQRHLQGHEAGHLQRLLWLCRRQAAVLRGKRHAAVLDLADHAEDRIRNTGSTARRASSRSGTTARATASSSTRTAASNSASTTRSSRPARRCATMPGISWRHRSTPRPARPSLSRAADRLRARSGDRAGEEEARAPSSTIRRARRR